MQLKNLETMNNNGDFCFKCNSYVLKKVNSDLVSPDVSKLVNTKVDKDNTESERRQTSIFCNASKDKFKRESQQKQPHVNIKPLAMTKA